MENTRLYIPNFILYRDDRHPGWKGGTTFVVRRGITLTQVDIPILPSIQATGICMPIANGEMLLAALYKSWYLE
jgi:hypothetical protein